LENVIGQKNKEKAKQKKIESIKYILISYGPWKSRDLEGKTLGELKSLLKEVESRGIFYKRDRTYKKKVETLENKRISLVRQIYKKEGKAWKGRISYYESPYINLSYLELKKLLEEKEKL
jgi:hypothetical protein